MTTASAHRTRCYCARAFSTLSGDPSALTSLPTRAKLRSPAVTLPSIILLTASPQVLPYALADFLHFHYPSPGPALREYIRSQISITPCSEDQPAPRSFKYSKKAVILNEVKDLLFSFPGTGSLIKCRSM